MKKCIACGKEINDSVKFCKFCGSAQSVNLTEDKDVMADNKAENAPKPDMYGGTPYGTPKPDMYGGAPNGTPKPDMHGGAPYGNPYINMYGGAPLGGTGRNAYSAMMPGYNAGDSSGMRGRCIISYIMVCLSALLAAGMIFLPFLTFDDAVGNTVKLSAFDFFKGTVDVFKGYVEFLKNIRITNISTIITATFDVGMWIVYVIIAFYAVISLIVSLIKLGGGNDDEKFGVTYIAYFMKLYMAVAFNIAFMSSNVEIGIGLIVPAGVNLVFLIILMLMNMKYRDNKNSIFSIIGVIATYVMVILAALPVAKIGNISICIGGFVEGIDLDNVNIKAKFIAICICFMLLVFVNSAIFAGTVRRYKSNLDSSSGLICAGVFNVILGIALCILFSLLKGEKIIKCGGIIIAFISAGVFEIVTGVLRKCLRDATY